MRVPDDLQDYCIRISQRGIKKRLDAVQPLSIGGTIDVVYIQPHDDGHEGECVISFQWIADYLRTLSDPLSKAFAEYVERWIEPAASRAPA